MNRFGRNPSLLPELGVSERRRIARAALFAGAAVHGPRLTTWLTPGSDAYERISGIAEEVVSEDERRAFFFDPVMVANVWTLHDHVEFGSRTFLILGEPGVGKEVLATVVWDALCSSGGLKRPIARWNCAALTSTLLMSELFGVMKGAYTGAVASEGAVAGAEGGVFVLDEFLDAASPDFQPALLRLLQWPHVFRAVGSKKDREFPGVIVASTNRITSWMEFDAAQRGDSPLLRPDIAARFDCVVIAPPLRERRAEEAASIARAILEDSPARAATGGAMEERIRQCFGSVGEDSLKALSRASRRWPGNVRGLVRFIYEQARLLRHQRPVDERPPLAFTEEALAAHDAAAGHVSPLESTAPGKDVVPAWLLQLRRRLHQSPLFKTLLVEASKLPRGPTVEWVGERTRDWCVAEGRSKSKTPNASAHWKNTFGLKMADVVDELRAAAR